MERPRTHRKKERDAAVHGLDRSLSACKFAVGKAMSQIAPLKSRWHSYQTLIDAIAACETETVRGITFLEGDGSERFYPYSELYQEVLRRAALLRARGIRPGDRIAMVLPRGIDFVPTFFAAVWAGIVPVPLYPPLAMAKLDTYLETLVGILKKAQASAAVIDSRLAPVLWNGLGKLPLLKHVFRSDDFTNLADAPNEPPERVTPETICFLQFTSGSTATPKGVAITHGNIIVNMLVGYEYGLEFNPKTDSSVSWLPLYHDMGLIGFLIAPLIYRANIALIPTLSFLRNPAIWFETIHRTKATVSFAPNFAYSLAVKRTRPEQRAAWDLSRMRHFGNGAEPVNPATVRAFLSAFSASGLKPSAMRTVYGMAESTVAVAFIRPDAHFPTDIIDRNAFQTTGLAVSAPASALTEGTALEFPSCGGAFPEHEFGIFSAQGQSLPDRQVGELWLRGPSVASGYYRDPEATARTFADGWLHTGDLAYLVDGNLFITGRKKDLVILHGRNYTPQDFEWAIERIPDVRKGSAVAFSRPGEASEELVIALESRTTDPKGLAQQVREHISLAFGVGTGDVLVCPPGTLPKTSSGKLQRATTRAKYLDGSLAREGDRTLGSQASKLLLAKHFMLSLLGRARFQAKRLLRTLFGDKATET